jgi:hypothetical protein
MYDLRADPEEQQNLIELGTAPAIELEAMMQELVHWIPPDERTALEAIGNRFDRLPTAATTNVAPQKGGAAAQGADAVDTKLLRSLGYVQ